MADSIGCPGRWVMEIKATKGNPTDVAADVLVVPLFTDDAVNRGP